jgi:hypothetical protein
MSLECMSTHHGCDPGSVSCVISSVGLEVVFLPGIGTAGCASLYYVGVCLELETTAVLILDQETAVLP